MRVFEILAVALLERRTLAAVVARHGTTRRETAEMAARELS
jgi:hypothetical protein